MDAPALPIARADADVLTEGRIVEQGRIAKAAGSRIICNRGLGAWTLGPLINSAAWPATWQTQRSWATLIRRALLQQRELHHLGPLLCFLCEEPAEVAGEPTSPIPPKAASRALIFASVRAALISLLSASTISVRVLFVVPIPGLHLQRGDVSSARGTRRPRNISRD
jgi:hypothetical protein